MEQGQMREIKIGSRESKLAVIQTNLVEQYIRENCEGYCPKIVTMKTTGDKILDRTLDKVGGKGLFVKELDAALRSGRSDLSVHSLKDVPMEVEQDLPLIGYSAREDVRDVLVLPKDCDTLNPNLPIGSSSMRRILQLREIFPQMEVKSVRGNVLTRLEKLDRGEYSALILAAAGLKRLGLEERISRYFTVEEMIPAAGQGILALQGRRGVDYSFLEGFLDSEATMEAECERAFVRRLNGGCSSPIAAHARLGESGSLRITGLYCKEGRTDYIRETLTGRTQNPVELGERLAEQMLEHYKQQNK